MKKSIIILLTFAYIFLNLNAFSQVTTDNLIKFGWDIKKKPLSSINSGAYFVCGPNTPPSGQGSLQLTIKEIQDRVLFRNNEHNRTFLKDITELSYWTSSNQSDNAPYLTIQIDKDGTDGIDKNDLNIVFVPNFQPGLVVMLNSWQQWNAYHLLWSFYNPNTKQFWNPKKDEAIPDGDSPKDYLFTLDWYMNNKNGINKNAMIINTDPATGGGPGIRFGAGMGGDPGSTEWIGFDGNIDLFKIIKGGKETIYDFEYKLKVTNIKQGLCFGYPNIIGSRNVVPGTSYSWTSTGGDLSVPENSPYLIITPTTATPPTPVTYTLTETTAGGVHLYNNY